MIKLELNKIPGYTLCDSGFVTLVFANGYTTPTCLTKKALGIEEVEDEPQPKEDKTEVHKVTEGTLLQVIAMLHGVKEIPR